MKHRKTHIISGMVASWVILSPSAYAQNVQPAEVTNHAADLENGSNAGGNGEIVVTAQKKTERLLDVPVAITAIGAASLTTQGLNRLQDFYDRIPGLQYSGQRVSSLALRGITTGNGSSPTVAILVDDVQFGGTTNAGQPPIPDFDASAMERIEVLRGPQGTLYGAASLGGLIKYVLKQPDTEKFSGRIEAGGTTVANGSEGYAVRGSVNLPIADWLAVTASGFKREDAPYLDNFRGNKKDVNTRDVWGYRAAVLIKPFDNFKITGSALRQKLDAMNSDLTVSSGGVPICKICTLTTTPAPVRTTAITSFEPVYGDMTINAIDSTNKIDFSLYTGRADLTLGKVTISSISAWGKSDTSQSNDVSVPFAFIPPSYGSAGSGGSVMIANDNLTTKFSEELRASVQLGAFDLLAGGFYTVEHAATDQTLFLLNSSSANIATPYAVKGPSRYREIAGFADVTWHATDKLDIQVGGRYATNKQSYASSTVIDGPVVPVFGPSQVITAGSKDNAFTFLVSPTYHFSRDIMAYLRIANGYRPGGPNLDNAQFPTFGPDRVINYEMGFKGRVVPGLLTIDTALFQIDWTDIQLVGTGSNQLSFIANGGKARSRGLEFAANLTPWPGMTIDGNLTFTDATLRNTLPRLSAASISGQEGDRLPYGAKVTGSITAQQTFNLSEGLEARASINYTYVGDRPGAFNTFNGTRPRILIPEYGTINLTGGLTYDNIWSLTGFVRNLTDRRGVSAAQNGSGTTAPYALFIAPRTIGLTLARTF